MMIAICIATVSICWATGLALIYRGLTDERTEGQRPVSTNSNSITLNSDVEGLA